MKNTPEKKRGERNTHFFRTHQSYMYQAQISLLVVGSSKPPIRSDSGTALTSTSSFPFISAGPPPASSPFSAGDMNDESQRVGGYVSMRKRAPDVPRWLMT